MQLFKGIRVSLLDFKPKMMSSGHYGKGIYLGNEKTAKNYTYSTEQILLEYYCPLNKKELFLLTEKNFPEIYYFRPNELQEVKEDLKDILNKDYLKPGRLSAALQSKGYKGINVTVTEGKKDLFSDYIKDTPDGGHQVLVFNQKDIELKYIHFSFNFHRFKNLKNLSSVVKSLKIALDFYEASYDTSFESGFYTLPVKIKAEYLADFQNLLLFHNSKVLSLSNLDFEFKVDYIKRVVFNKESSEIISPIYLALNLDSALASNKNKDEVHEKNKEINLILAKLGFQIISPLNIFNKLKFLYNGAFNFYSLTESHDKEEVFELVSKLARTENLSGCLISARDSDLRLEVINLLNGDKSYYKNKY